MPVKLTSLEAGYFKCDGGALFGVIPKVLWNKQYPSDENNFVNLSMRCLLLESEAKKILIDTGPGNHFSEKFIKNNGIENAGMLEKSLAMKNLSVNDITDVVFTHLHWDHCTGAVSRMNEKLELTFPNADYWCSITQWEHSQTSNDREKAAYHLEVLTALNNSGKLKFTENWKEIPEGLSFKVFNGHTPGQLIPVVKTNHKTFVYCADLIPTSANIPLLWIAAYDLLPVTVMEEKKQMLTEVIENEYILFFEHDFYTECARVGLSKNGGFEMLNSGNLEMFTSEN